MDGFTRSRIVCRTIKKYTENGKSLERISVLILSYLILSLCRTFDGYRRPNASHVHFAEARPVLLLDLNLFEYNKALKCIRFTGLFLRQHLVVFGPV